MEKGIVKRGLVVEGNRPGRLSIRAGGPEEVHPRKVWRIVISGAGRTCAPLGAEAKTGKGKTESSAGGEWGVYLKGVKTQKKKKKQKTLTKMARLTEDNPSFLTKETNANL